LTDSARHRLARAGRGAVNLLQGTGELLLKPAGLVSPVFRQGPLLAEIDHRPWPLRPDPWFMRQTWCDLLFAHWRVTSEQLRAVVPPQLTLETFDGSAWVGVTPFLVHGLRLRGTFPAPVLSRFPEINVRTYVVVDGKPGIYFLSLDAARRSAVIAARRTYRLPYFRAEMRQSSNDEVAFRSRRTSGDGPEAQFEARYRPTGGAEPPLAGSLEHFLTERYCLYTLDEGQRVLRADIHHPPWPLQPASVQLLSNTMSLPFGLDLEGQPLAHFSARQDVLLWQTELAHPTRPADPVKPHSVDRRYESAPPDGGAL
jgi:uncharacterized protein YqjF (DUF2071 family)